MTIALRHPFEDLTFLTPLSEARAHRLTQFLAQGLDGTVLDIGCGWGELLLRVVRAAPSAQGIGVDLDEFALGRGRELVRQRGLEDRVTLLEQDGATYQGEPARAAICIGAGQVWGPPVEDSQPLDYARALGAIRSKVERGAHVVFGEGIWSSPPSAAAAAPLSGRLDEFVGLAELIEIAIACGFAAVAVHEANLDEWDEFESGYSACYAAWLAEHPPDHPDADEVRRRAARQRVGYFAGYRGVLGMAYLCLIAL